MTITSKFSATSTAWAAMKAIVPAAFFLTACSAANDPGQFSAAAPTDRFAFTSIQQGDWSVAETQLRDSDQDDPLVLLNLAYVMSQQGHSSEAADIYRTILDGSENPFATMGGGQPRRVKRVALQALLALEPEN